MPNRPCLVTLIGLTLAAAPVYAGRVTLEDPPAQEVVDPVATREVVDPLPVLLEQFDVAYRSKYQAIGRSLIEKEAAKRKRSVNDLLNAEIKVKVKPISEDEIRRAVADIPEADRGFFAGELRKMVRESELEAARNQYYERLMVLYDVNPLDLEPVSEEMRARLEKDATVTGGNKDAKHHVVVWCDYVATECKDLQAMLAAAVEKDPSKVRWAWRHFPQHFNEGTLEAAEAAVCASAQGKAAEYHGELLAYEGYLNRDAFSYIALDLGLDMTEFNQCVDQGAGRHTLDASLDDAATLGVMASPSLLVNGVVALPDTFRIRSAMLE